MNIKIIPLHRQYSIVERYPYLKQEILALFNHCTDHELNILKQLAGNNPDLYNMAANSRINYAAVLQDVASQCRLFSNNLSMDQLYRRYYGSPTYLASQVGSGPQYIYIAVVPNVDVPNKPFRCVGCLYAQHQASNVIYISSLVVHPEFRQLGIGKLLLNALINERPSSTPITLVVLRNNTPAEQLYNKLGFLRKSLVIYDPLQKQIKHIPLSGSYTPVNNNHILIGYFYAR